MTEPLHLTDVTIVDSPHALSITKLLGKTIVDVHGYVSRMGDDFLVKLTKLELSDGTVVGIEGEHDFPYLVPWGSIPQPNLDGATLQRLYDEANSSR